MFLVNAVAALLLVWFLILCFVFVLLNQAAPPCESTVNYFT